MVPLITGELDPRNVNTGTERLYNQRCLPSVAFSPNSLPSMVWTTTTPRPAAGTERISLDTWERQQSDPGYAFDTPLPATAKEGRAGWKALAEEASIGELAPKGLE